jgi:hypothetical protein
VRRNITQPNWRTLPAEGRPGTAPACPEIWLQETKDWWDVIWRSPMATVWLESDVPALVRLGDLIEIKAKSATGAADVAGEIRQIEDRFGLSPKSRRQLMWNVEDPADVGTELVAKVRRLRAV